ncbi:glutamate racemase [Tenuifilum thalassicum]|uniref:Glutamate racemase n=1 Tax=Tenuifilum thalassicum TaxID=2590900 RepID=A0A7D4C7G0_9BACT|nr:glutamate racemase [Tenuifilum thalassicum]QKG79002.1 glutamate racemase [Tenuifilum thalassicum]
MIKSNCNPIGIFDSGAGGLSVLSELVKKMPNERFVYFADTLHCPYGSKPADKIIKLSDNITKLLISKGAKLIVVACNTATAASIDYLRSNYSIPFIGMEPAIKPASLNTKTKSIGVLATAGTFKGRLYIETSKKYASNVNVCYQVGEGLVELVETGKANSPEAEELLHRYVDSMIDCDIDHLVLGCTHYPFLIPTLKKIIPDTINIVNPAPAVAAQAYRVAKSNNLLCNQLSTQTRIDFYSSAKLDIIKQLVNNEIKPFASILDSYTENLSL